MCLLVFAWKTHPDFPLVFAGNRDELHARPAAAAGFWEAAPQLLAGRDLQAGGTWLGVTTQGRFAVVTNYRDGRNPVSGRRSRGELTSGFLRGEMTPQEYSLQVQMQRDAYAGFSLLTGDRDTLWYVSNRGADAQAVTPGIHGLSNHLLDTPWPKVTRSIDHLRLLLEVDHLGNEALLRLLADRTPAATAALPDTGIGVELERKVSAPFVVDPRYGTRCSTAILLGKDSIRFTERRFAATGEAVETRHFMIEATT
ncbi:MAG TPA: NRDE family protein [Gammaproteobacteria bacterium]|nr:NRDE family protein [Gammaproteobacteria bacterium]